MFFPAITSTDADPFYGPCSKMKHDAERRPKLAVSASHEVAPKIRVSLLTWIEAGTVARVLSREAY